MGVAYLVLLGEEWHLAHLFTDKVARDDAIAVTTERRFGFDERMNVDQFFFIYKKSIENLSIFLHFSYLFLKNNSNKKLA